MANDEHVALLRTGVALWNAWRNENPDIRPDLGEADFFRENLSEANLSRANLSRANLSRAYLVGANLIGANLVGANLVGANLSATDLFAARLSGADLRGTDLSGANLRVAELRGAKLRGANLQTTVLVDTDLSGADLTGCRIYGVSAWGLNLEMTKQQNLIITYEGNPKITVDNIEVAQFIYLMLHNQKIRDIIDTITSKAVLILGRFTDERKAVLDALREELRKRDYLPILFDFDKPTSQTTDETITLLARMSRFVIADISDAKSVLQELRAIVPDLPSVPVQPVITATQEEPGMFDFYRNFRSFLNVHRYASQEQLIADLGEKVIHPAELKVRDLRGST
jgi:Pentapeptide repeats (8 copies)